MPKRRVATVGPLNPDPALRIESRGRRGPPNRRDGLSATQVAQITRTVRRVPEVVVKVTGGGRDAAAVKAHLRYIDRHGRLPLVMDSGETLEGTGAAKTLSADWNLDALPRVPRSPHGKQTAGSVPQGKGPPKAVHNIVLSMPAKVDPDRVLAAAQGFARENFALTHRYALVLHTDTKHPHLHLVVKAERENGRGRLNIYKSTLRQWRGQFAAQLRAQGIEANATSAASRGRSRSRPKDVMRRATQRSREETSARKNATAGKPGSRFLAAKIDAVVDALTRNDVEPILRGKTRLLETFDEVTRRWGAVAQRLESMGDPVLAKEVRNFAAGMKPPRTDQERIVAALQARGLVKQPAPTPEPLERVQVQERSR